ncbi:MAG: hypothetical protein ACOZBH_03040 [Patescibacteria group bacterium]
MAEKQVPEEQQFEFLRQKLLGNEAFGRVRGTLGLIPDDELGILGTALAASESPTNFCQRWDQVSSDLRVFGNMLACFNRDGWEAASRELTRTLLDKTYRLPGETVPLHETEPVTVVVFDFSRTLTMIRWIRCAHWGDLNDYIREINDDRESVAVKGDWFERNIPRQLTIQLYESFPDLFRYIREGSGEYDYLDLVQSYRNHALGDIDTSQLSKIGYFLRLAWQTYNVRFAIAGLCLGYFCRTDQAEVLSRFSRQQQNRIATWTVRLPRVLLEEQKISSLWIGFHPEQVHEDWKNVSNVYASLGCSNGYGVVVMNGKYYDPLRDHTSRYHKKFSSQNVTLDDINEQLAFELEIVR